MARLMVALRQVWRQGQNLTRIAGYWPARVRLRDSDFQVVRRLVLGNARHMGAKRSCLHANLAGMTISTLR